MRIFSLALLIALPLPTLAEDAWQQVDLNPGAYWIATSNGRELQIRCNGDGLMMLLLGGETRLPPEVETDGEIAVGVTLWPSAYTDATPLSWLGAFDNALGGAFPSHPAFLAEFARSERLTIKADGPEHLFDTPMTGADIVRFGIGEVCGL